MSSTKPGSQQGAVFTTGSTMRHVLVMTSTGALGLMAIFFVDVVNLFYISLLGEQELAAAIGYAATILFFTISLSVGFSIATTAITARAIGKGDREAARKNAGSSIIYMTGMGIVMVAVLYPLLPYTLDLLGAEGRTHQLSLEFMQIVLLSSPLMAMGMSSSALLRAQGDAKRAMYVTLSAGAAALVFDPLFIFGFDLGIHGAALASAFTRIVMVCVGFHGIFIVHKMIAMPDLHWLAKTFKPYWAIAFPAVLTQIATPVGNAYVTAAISEFGDDAVAGWAIVGRLMPLSFAAVFALSGAVGSILSQNMGAGRIDRVHSTMRDSLVFAVIYTVVVWLGLALTYPWINLAFSAQGDAASMVRYFCLFVAGSFIFNGALFVANAAFNNLGYALYSTIFNWGRATLGIIPFVWIGKHYGAEGVLAGWGLGGVFFGVMAVVVCFRTISKLPNNKEVETMPTIPTANSPFTSGRGATNSS